MTNIILLTGDATDPISRPALITHVCNDRGAWGRGFVMALSRRWSAPEESYRAWHRGRTQQPFALGEVQFVEAERGIVVANMLAQRGLPGYANPQPLDYQALATCLRTVFAYAQRVSTSLHMPRIGCGLARGTWSRVAGMITEAGRATDVDAVVYT